MTDYKIFIEVFKKWAINQHDVECNQKYDKTLPYSYHLLLVESNVVKYGHLLNRGRLNTTEWLSEYHIALMAAIGHDLIEDARVTYNDVKKVGGWNVADIIYCLTDDKGKNRKERHSDRYFEDLKGNELAVFVKLCDVLANIKYSSLTNSRMLDVYKKEFPNLKKKLYINRWDELFTDIENIIKL